MTDVWIGAVTLFPEMFDAVTSHGITRRAAEAGLISVNLWNPREFTQDRHRTVDDRPYGGGPGMLMKIQPLKDAIEAAKQAAPANPVVAYMSPQGRPLNQTVVRELAGLESLILVSGRYEGIDERVIESDIDVELSLGDFVLSGGELASMVVIDAVTRMLPGALGHADSAEQDSFADGLLDCPHYTRPEVYEGKAVPEVLLGGHHEQIRRWRLKQSLQRTLERRPDLLKHRQFSQEEQLILAELENESSAPDLSGHKKTGYQE